MTRIPVMGKPELEYENIHGRQFGRGIRPYLLIVKIACVATCLGTTISLLVLVFWQPPPDSIEGWWREAEMVGRAYRALLVPALIVTLCMGGLLASAHLPEFLRMRWVQSKLFLVLISIPSLHFYMYDRMLAYRAAIHLSREQGWDAVTAVRDDLEAGTIATLVFLAAMIVLGRIKPRLGQDYGRTFSRGRVPQE